MDFLILYLGRRGAGTAYTSNLARALKDNGLDVKLIYSKQNECRDEFSNLGVNTVPVYTFKNTLEFLLFSPIVICSLLYKLFNILRAEKPKAIICTMHHVWGPVIGWFFRLMRVSYVLVVHDAEIHPGDGGYFHKKILEFHLNSASKWVALSSYVAKKLVQKGFRSEDIEIIPHGVFPYYVADKPRSLKGKNEIIITFFGRILYYKGLDILLDAWPAIVSAVPNAILYICGFGSLPDSKVMETHRKSIRLRNEWIDDSQIVDIFKDTDLMVFPYREASQSGVLAIAFPAAIPVVATPLEGLREQLKFGGGKLSTSTEASDFAVAIIDVVKNDEIYSKLSLDSFGASLYYSWDIIAKKFGSLIK